MNGTKAVYWIVLFAELDIPLRELEVTRHNTGTSVSLKTLYIRLEARTETNPYKAAIILVYGKGPG